ncbi:TPA: hypothetical protein HA246_05195 [Candidatus Woesearchaeota archaeon]|nr:hypothetical protein [Candidatus Woesearchaeota archaeon]
MADEPRRHFGIDILGPTDRQRIDDFKKWNEGIKQKQAEAVQAAQARVAEVAAIISPHPDSQNLLPDQKAKLNTLMNLKHRKEAKYNELMQELAKREKADRGRLEKLTKELIALLNDIIEILSRCSPSGISASISDILAQLKYQRDRYFQVFLDILKEMEKWYKRKYTTEQCVNWETKYHSKYEISRNKEHKFWELVKNDSTFIMELVAALPVR